MDPEDYKETIFLMKNIRKMYIAIILLIIISISVSPVIGGNDQSINNQSISNKSINNQPVKKQINYRIAIDQYRGFYRVYIANTSGIMVHVSYNGTLNITKGDTITWMNDAMPDARLTVISQQKLWSDNSGVLKWAYKQFSYTFNKSGIYDVYIRENSKFKQKIIVGQLELSSVDMTKTNISGPNKNISKSNSTKDLSKVTNSSKITNTTNKAMNTTNKAMNTTNKAMNTTKSPKVVNSNNLTNVSKNGEANNEKYNVFIILPIMAVISIIYIKRFQKKAK